MGAPTPGPDVNFDFGQALSLARQYYAMAGEVSSYQSQRDGLAHTALTEWRGVYSEQFRSRMRTSDGTAAELESAVKGTAQLYAEAWQHACQQQKMVEWARHCQALDNKRNVLQKAWDSIFGDATTFPPPPGSPAVPSAPDFAPTTDPYSYP